MDGYLSRLDDERLAKLSAGEGQRAFATLYERHHQALFRYCATIVRDDADAQDALQATWMRALVALRRGQRDAPLRPWLYRIAHNESVSILRRRGRVAEPLRVPACPLASAEDGALQRERFAQLVADLRALPERPRSALVLRELTGLSHEEIALTLETTVAAAKQSIYEARCGLQDLAQGRAMACEELRRRVSDGGRRVLRGRRVRAHVRDCPECAAFAAAMTDRRAVLSAFVPALPAAASWEILRRLSGGAAAGGAAAGGGAIGGGAAAGAGGAAAVASKALGAGFAAKSLALTGVALTAAAVTVTVTGVTGSHTPRFQASASHASAVASHHRGGAGSRPTTAAAQQPAATTIASAPLLAAAPPGAGAVAGARGAGRRHGGPDGRGGRVAARGGPAGALHDRGTPGAGGSAAERANGANGSSASAPGATPGNSAAANAGVHGSSAAAYGSSAAAAPGATRGNSAAAHAGVHGSSAAAHAAAHGGGDAAHTAAHGSSAAAHAGAHRGSTAAHASSAAQQDDASASGDGSTAAPTGATTAAVPAGPGNSAAAHAKNAHK